VNFYIEEKHKSVQNNICIW